jgi:GNAT superfamily N-acetyltransferase
VSSRRSAPVVQALHGATALPHLGALAELRMEVFRQYPYLYQGTLDYEERYLRGYAETARGVIVIARDGDQVVGASTGVPLIDHGEDMAPALAAAGLDVSTIYYFGESVLRASYRGLGVGHAFFDQREAAARSHGFPVAAFCAVDRGSDHPARPRDYVPLDAFWKKRGYTRRPDIVARFSWRDIGEPRETEKPMVFWLKDLAA